MDRLQKKCLIATAGTHLLLILILIVGPGFFKSTPKVDDMPVLLVIPPLTDGKMNSGQPTPTQPPPSPKPLPPQPKPEVTPPPPKPIPTPDPPKPEVKPVEPDQPDQPDKPSPEAIVPVKPKVKHPPHKIEVDISHPVKRVIKNTDNTDAEADAKEAKRERDAARKAFTSAMKNIEKNSSTATEVTMPGTSSVSYANFAQAVKSIYDRAWTAPDDAANEDANTIVKVTIASDGSVVSSRIVTPSGDAKVDASVQRALDNVTFIGPFPDGATEKTRTFTINFNLQSKRQDG